MQSFIDYSDIIFDAFCLHSKTKDIVDRKQEILTKIQEHYNQGATTILFVGFNPAILACPVDNIYVAEVSDRVLVWLQENNKRVTLFKNEPMKFDIVVAFDEYLTFADTEDQQKYLVDNLCNLSTGLVITTVKDYKNQEFKDREYSQPAIIKANNRMTAFTEIHDWDQTDKNSWSTMVYELQGTDTKCHGVYRRRALYFKQLAKFTLDKGAAGFLVHKNLMYKSLIKKNYEHVISIHFENYS